MYFGTGVGGDIMSACGLYSGWKKEVDELGVRFYVAGRD